MPKAKQRRASEKRTAKPKPRNLERMPVSSPPPASAPGNEQDIKRRLGNFTGAGEHARVGGRTSGIVGQTTKRNHTDRGRTKPARAKKLGKAGR